MSLVWKFYNIAEIKIQKTFLKSNKQLWHIDSYSQDEKMKTNYFMKLFKL